ncbi:MAG TPA: GspMb/PilO family protein [Candidatus Acidoferrum sp.]|nr:GspMb/PilO family protein [Candidatus Acidoferrum sp.]
MSNFKIQKRVIIAALGILFLLDAALAYHNSQLAATRQNPEQVLAAQSRQLAAVKADVERASQIKTGMPEVQRYFDQFENTLPPLGKGYSMISQELDDIARSTHILVQDVKFRQKEITGRNVDEIEVEATLDGDYAGIVRFLNELQRSKNTYVVDSLGLDSDFGVGPGSQGAPGNVKVALHFRSYFRKT